MSEQKDQGNNTNPSDFMEALNITDDSLGINQQKPEVEEKKKSDPFGFIPADDDITRQYILDKKWQSPNDIITEFQNLEKTLDDHFKDHIAPPDSLSSLEEIENYGRTIGRPDTPDDYDISHIENMDEEGRKELLDLCHNALMNPYQVERFVKAREERDRKVRKENREQFKQETENLYKEWGKKKDLNEKLMKSGIAVLKVPTSNLKQLQKEIGPRAFAQTMIAIGERSSELGRSPSGMGNRRVHLTVADAHRKRDELLRDPQFIVQYNRRDAEAIKQIKTLNSLIAKSST